MTVLQLSSLFYLRRFTPCPYPTFVAGMKVARPTATHTLDSLARLGFVERKRSALDRRRTTIELLPAGETFLEMFTGPTRARP